MPGCVVLLTLSACAPHFIGPQATGVRPVIEGESFVSYDGTRLPLRSWIAPDRSRAVIIAVHGFNDYSNFITDPALWFSEHNLSVYAYDQRGFGNAPKRGFWPGKEAYAEDLQALIQAIKTRYPDKPLFLLGESMGAAVVLNMLASRKISVEGVILAAPAVRGWDAMPWWQRWGVKAAAFIMPWKTFTGQSLGIVVSDNREMLIALGRDPLVIKATRVDTLYGLVDLMQAGFEAVGKLQGPALILYGEKDQVIEKEPVLASFGPLTAANSNQHLYLYKNGYHMLLRDLQAELLWADIVSWISDRYAPLPTAQQGLSRE